MLETGELLLVSASALLVTLSFQYWVTRATPKEDEEGNNNNNNNNMGNSKGKRRKSEKEERRLERRRESQAEERHGVDVGLQVDHCCCEKTRVEAKKEVERQKQEEVRRRREEELRRDHEESEKAIKEEKVVKLEREVERLRTVEAEVLSKLRGEEEEVARLEQLLGNQQQVMKTALARLFPTAAPITFCEEHLAHLRKRQWLEEAKTT